MAAAFDYIIVGAGSAGCVLANRLSRDPAVSVCLIEAGPRDSSPFITVPLGVVWLSKDPKHNWLFKSTPQSGLGGRVVAVPRGKVLGGSSAINGMIYIRGHRADYDEWGCEGWRYDDVLSYFEKSLDLLGVEQLQSAHAIDHDFIAAAGQLQIHPCANLNAPEPEGVNVYDVTQHNGKRHSTARAFLAKRHNLSVMAKAEAKRIVFDSKIARAVVIRQGAAEQNIVARREIILAAGAIGSPDLLLRSGVGPAAQIKACGLAVEVDLAGVGQNLQDHVDMMVICKTKSAKPYGLSLRALPRLAIETTRWFMSRRGMFASNLVEAGGFVRSQASEPRPDLQLHFIPGRKSHRGRMVEWGHGISLHCCVLRPESRGSVWRKPGDGPPAIDLGLLQAGADLERLLRGVKLARRILEEQPLRQHGLTELVPGIEAQTDDELREAIRKHARTVYHPVGTCRMGTGRGAVVDPSLKVRGLGSLRVADASIMPRITSGNTNAPAIMIAEKAADMIMGERRLRNVA